MQTVLLMATILGAIGFVLGFLGSFFFGEITLGGRLGAGVLTGGMTFLAAAVMAMVDLGRQSRARDWVRGRLAAKADVEDEEFCRAMDFGDDSLLLDIRRALAEYFGSSPLKIHADDTMKEYEYDTVILDLPLFVLSQLCKERRREMEGFDMTTDPQHSFKEFAREVQRAFAQSQPGADYWSAEGDR